MGLDTEKKAMIGGSVTTSVLTGINQYLKGSAMAQNAIITGRNMAFTHRSSAHQQLDALRSIGRESEEQIRTDDISYRGSISKLEDAYVSSGVSMSGSAARNLGNAKLRRQLRRASMQNAAIDAVSSARIEAATSMYNAKLAEIEGSLDASLAKAGTFGAIAGTIGKGIIDVNDIYNGKYDE